MRMCKRLKVANFRGNAKFANRGGMRRVNLIEQSADQSEDSSEVDEDKVVLRLEGGNVTPPFMLKGKMNKQPFTTMIDSGSPITSGRTYKRRRTQLIKVRFGFFQAPIEKRTICRL